MLRSSRSRLTTPCVLDSAAVALLLGAMAILFYYYRNDELEASLERAATMALAQASHAVHAELDIVTGDVLLLASHADRSLEGTQDRLEALLQLRLHYRHAQYIDNQGRTLTRADRAQAAFGVADAAPPISRSDLLRTLALGPGQLHASAPTSNPNTAASSLIYFSTPVFDDHLQRHGAIVVAYETAGLQRALATLPRPRGSTVELVDGPEGPSADTPTKPNLYRWSKDESLIPAGANPARKITLRYSLANEIVAHAKHKQMSWAFALWLVTVIPVAALVCIARGARASERTAGLALAESQDRLLEAERVARIGYWRWEAREEKLTLSPQAAAMLGKQPGEQSVKLVEATALHALGEERAFFERIEQVMSTGEAAAEDIRITALPRNRWLHSIIRPARDKSGRIIGVFGTLQDITARKNAEEELRSLKADYVALLDHIPAGVTYMNLDGRCVMVNETILKNTGLRRDQFEGRLYDEIFTPEEAQQRLATNFEVIRTETPKLGRVERVKGRNGTSEHWLRIDTIPRRDGSGRVIGVVVFVVDITELKDIEHRLRTLTSEREMILNRIPAFVLYKDLSGYIVHANRMAGVYARKPLESIIGRHGTEIFPNADPEMIRRVDEEILRTAEPKLGILATTKGEDGITQYYEIDVFPNFDETGAICGIVVFGLDVSERKHAERQIAYLAMHDPLTDLCNRRLLADRLTQALEHCRRHDRHCALLFIDLDRFKAVNDDHGHEIGDLLLVEVARRLRSCVRTTDTVARTGGDEFIILLAETSTSTDAALVAEKIRASIAQPFEIRGIAIQIGSSIGIASYPELGRTEHELMCAADTAMYAAKRKGGSSVQVAMRAVPLSEHDAA